MPCKRICKLKKLRLDHGRKSYDEGGRYCATCRMWMQTEAKRCFCCNVQLRTHPRNVNDGHSSRLDRLEQNGKLKRY